MQTSTDEIQQAIESEINDGVSVYGIDFKIRILKIVSLEKMLTPCEVVEKSNKKILIPLADWNKHHSYPTVRQLRTYYYNRHENGFDYCVEYGGANGGRILIDEEKFFVWHEKNSNKRKMC